MADLIQHEEIKSFKKQMTYFEKTGPFLSFEFFQKHLHALCNFETYKMDIVKMRVLQGYLELM